MATGRSVAVPFSTGESERCAESREEATLGVQGRLSAFVRWCLPSWLLSSFYFGGGGTLQATWALTLPAASIAKTNASPVPMICQSVSPACPVALPIFLAIGVAPG